MKEFLRQWPFAVIITFGYIAFQVVNIFCSIGLEISPIIFFIGTFVGSVGSDVVYHIKWRSVVRRMEEMEASLP